MEYENNLQTRITNPAVSMTAEEEPDYYPLEYQSDQYQRSAGYTSPQGHEGFVGMVDYPDSSAAQHHDLNLRVRK